MQSAGLSVFAIDLPIGIALIDDALCVQRHNPAWRDLLGVHTDSLVGVQLFDLLPNDRLLLEPLIRRAQRGERVEQPALRLSVHHSIAYWDLTLTPLAEEDGGAGALLLTAVDVTERSLTRQLLERRVADRTRKLTALYDIMSAAVEADDLPALLQEALRRVVAATHAAGGVVQLLTADESALNLAAHVGVDPAVAARLRTLSAEVGVQDWFATAAERPLRPADPAVDWRTAQLLRVGEFNVYAAAPMNAGGFVIGALSIFRERKRAFGLEDLALLASAADQIAIACENLRLRAENERLLLVQERNRLARDLHDAVTQSLYSVLLFAGAAQRQAQQGNLPRVGELIDRLTETAHQALKEMRLLVYNLRPSALTADGLVGALRRRLAAVEQRANVRTRLTADPALCLPPAVEEALYQIGQEALNNALKHADASEVQVTLTQTAEGVVLCVRDNGRGFAAAAVADTGGLGLTSMRERAEAHDGRLTITSAPGCGTAVCAELPLVEGAPAAAQALP